MSDTNATTEIRRSCCRCEERETDDQQQQVAEAEDEAEIQEIQGLLKFYCCPSFNDLIYPRASHSSSTGSLSSSSSSSSLPPPSSSSSSSLDSLTLEKVKAFVIAQQPKSDNNGGKKGSDKRYAEQFHSFITWFWKQDMKMLYSRFYQEYMGLLLTEIENLKLELQQQVTMTTEMMNEVEDSASHQSGLFDPTSVPVCTEIETTTETATVIAAQARTEHIDTDDVNNNNESNRNIRQRRDDHHDDSGNGNDNEPTMHNDSTTTSPSPQTFSYTFNELSYGIVIKGRYFDLPRLPSFDSTTIAFVINLIQSLQLVDSSSEEVASSSILSELLSSTPPPTTTMTTPTSAAPMTTTTVPVQQTTITTMDCEVMSLPSLTQESWMLNEHQQPQTQVDEVSHCVGDTLPEDDDDAIDNESVTTTTLLSLSLKTMRDNLRSTLLERFTLHQQLFNNSIDNEETNTKDQLTFFQSEKGLFFFEIISFVMFYQCKLDYLPQQSSPEEGQEGEDGTESHAQPVQINNNNNNSNNTNITQQQPQSSRSNRSTKKKTPRNENKNNKNNKKEVSKDTISMHLLYLFGQAIRCWKYTEKGSGNVTFSLIKQLTASSSAAASSSTRTTNPTTAKTEKMKLTVRFDGALKHIKPYRLQWYLSKLFESFSERRRKEKSKSKLKSKSHRNSLGNGDSEQSDSENNSDSENENGNGINGSDAMRLSTNRGRLRGHQQRSITGQFDVVPPVVSTTNHTTSVITSITASFNTPVNNASEDTNSSPITQLLLHNRSRSRSTTTCDSGRVEEDMQLPPIQKLIDRVESNRNEVNSSHCQQQQTHPISQVEEVTELSNVDSSRSNDQLLPSASSTACVVLSQEPALQHRNSLNAIPISYCCSSHDNNNNNNNSLHQNTERGNSSRSRSNSHHLEMTSALYDGNGNDRMDNLHAYNEEADILFDFEGLFTSEQLLFDFEAARDEVSNTTTSISISNHSHSHNTSHSTSQSTHNNGHDDDDDVENILSGTTTHWT